MNKIGLYVHIPFCVSKCRYCGFYSAPLAGKDTQSLINALIAELTHSQNLSLVDTAYIGGGSPTCLPTNQLTTLIKHINDKCPNIQELTVECNPQQLTSEMANELKAEGVNRISIGAQSFDDDQLKTLGRIHSVSDIYSAVDAAKQAGFDNISIDLIFAIPGSNLQSWQKTLKKAIDLNVQHISAYALSYEDNTPMYNDLANGKITKIDEETDRQMYKITIETLEKAGFERYEISNFAKPDCQCKHNIKYWQSDPFIGIGPAAASFIDNKRITNIAKIDEYTNRILSACSAADEVIELSETDRTSQTAILNLRMRNGINILQFKKQLGIDASKIFAQQIEKYTQLGFVEKNDEQIFLTTEALPIANSVVCDFMID